MAIKQNVLNLENLNFAVFRTAGAETFGEAELLFRIWCLEFRICFEFVLMKVYKLLSEMQKNISLADYATLRIGGAAKYFFVAKNQEDIIKALKTAKEFNLPFFILGGGSNLLVGDEGFNGLIIKIQNSKFEIQGGKIITDAGVSLSKLVIESVNAGLSGLEWAVGIPGTIAGAVVGNAGAYGHSISESVERIKTLSFSSLRAQSDWAKQSRYTNMGSPRSLRSLAMTEREYNNKECQFGYRESVFKTSNNIILEVALKLQKGDKEKSQKQIKNILSQKKNKVPTYPSAGSIFKNYEVRSENYEDDFLIKKYPELLGRIQGGKIATGYLIEQCGLKGKKIGGAMIAQEHANFIVNAGGAKAEDVVALIKLCKEKVKEKFGIELEEEIRLIGF